MYYLIETSKEGRIRKLRKWRTKYGIESQQATLDKWHTTTIHKFKNDAEVMNFIHSHNTTFPLTRFTSVPAK